MAHATRFPIGTPLSQRRNAPIHAPGSRLFTALKLRSLERRPGARHTRGISFELNLTSMIDYLVIVVVFLLAQFASSQECCAVQPVDLPSAPNAHEIVSAPIVSITARAILLDGQRVANPAEVLASTDRIDRLFERLADARRSYPVLHPNEPFEGNVVMQIERGTSWGTIRRVLATASLAGYVQPQFAVNRATHVNGVEGLM